LNRQSKTNIIVVPCDYMKLRGGGGCLVFYSFYYKCAYWASWHM